MNGFVSSEPRHLPLGIMAGVLLYQLHRAVQIVFPVQVREQLLVTHRLQTVQRPLRVYPFRFFQQPRVHHLLHALVNARVQLSTLTLQSHFHDPERTLTFCPLYIVLCTLSTQ